MRDSEPGPRDALRDLRGAAIQSCAVCLRELAAASFPGMAWSFSWTRGRSTWCADCIEEASNLRSQGFAGTLRELKERTRARVVARAIN